MDKLKAGAYIANIDAKDIFLSNHLINPQNDSKGRSTGYSLKYRIGEHKGEWNFRRFGAKLDYSLDLIKMQEVDQRVRNAGNFIFESDGKSYSIHVINVTFKYSIKQFNRTGANTYVKFGYSPETLVFQDSVALIDGELIGITLNETINRPISDDVLGQYFCYQNGTYQRTKKVIPVLHKIDEIRKDIYKSGFYCDGIHYVRYKRSAGSSRVGNCLFINEKLYSQMMKWSLCGLTIREGQAVDLAALEAYISLTLSSIIDTIQIRPENILVIEDYKSVFKDHAVATRFVDGHLHSSPDEVEISNSIWDGQSLMDRSVFLQFQEQQRKNNPDAKILLCAPTGRAARRMFESTGQKAFTIHKALNLQANEEGIYEDAELLEYDLIIVDEISMLDMFLARTFFKSIKEGTQVVLIGDSNQLPSVGPGAVLAEIIASEVVKVAKLTRVYRQQSESLIALNSLLMCKGKYTLDYGDDFVFIPAKDWEDAAKLMKKEYMNAVEEVGIDDVSMLSPFRSNKTATGVDSLNLEIKDIINPPTPSKKEMVAFGKIFREGDKVMQTKTTDDISNGDIGYITKIIGSDGEQIAIIDFGDERVVEYYQSDMETIDWAYATTVHKSQGSEYKIVIFNIMEGHSIMLKRNLAYTAVTRAKSKVIIIGNKSALVQAIKTGIEDEDKRNTMLAIRLKMMKEKRELTA